MTRQLSYTGVEDENRVGMDDETNESPFDMNSGVEIRFEDAGALRRAIFTNPDNSHAPLHTALSNFGAPSYRLKGNVVIVNPLRGQELDRRILDTASKVSGVLSVSELVCK